MQPSNGSPLPHVPQMKRILPGLAELCESPHPLLETIDVGGLNLMCALGLPGAEALDIAGCCEWLDEAAQAVNYETRRHWYRFEQSPEDFRRSPGYFCCFYLLQVLQEELGVQYNPARVRDPTFQDPKCF